MKRLIVSGFLAVGIAAVLSISVNAQLANRYTAKVPFDFSIGSKRFEAGDYSISALGGVTSLRALYLHSNSTGKGRVIGSAILRSSDSEEPGSMVFVKADNGWVLQSVETATFRLKLRRSPKAENNNVASDIYSPETRTVRVGN
jgi:hypothetical protein